MIYQEKSANINKRRHSKSPSIGLPTVVVRLVGEPALVEPRLQVPQVFPGLVVLV
jgi:hypothetical protein